MAMTVWRSCHLTRSRPYSARYQSLLELQLRQEHFCSSWKWEVLLIRTIFMRIRIIAGYTAEAGAWLAPHKKIKRPLVVNPDHFDAIPDPGCFYILGKSRIWYLRWSITVLQMQTVLMLSRTQMQVCRLLCLIKNKVQPIQKIKADLYLIARKTPVFTSPVYCVTWIHWIRSRTMFTSSYPVLQLLYRCCSQKSFNKFTANYNKPKSCTRYVCASMSDSLFSLVKSSRKSLINY